jgi:4a-hydroxytetrahydrobiopterin dehydratase
MREPLGREAIDQALKGLDGWRFDEDRLLKTFEFGSFREAVSFIVRMAFEAEQRDHHPEIHNVYNRVDVSLATHDAGDRVTRKDVELAEAIESFSWK